MPIVYDMESYPATATDIFEFEYQGMVFRDAIILPLVEYNAMPPEQLDAMKQARFDAWLASITHTTEEVA